MAMGNATLVGGVDQWMGDTGARRCGWGIDARARRSGCGMQGRWRWAAACVTEGASALRGGDSVVLHPG